MMTSSPENIDYDCISVELLSLPEKICFHEPDDNPEPISSEDEERFESFDWSEFVEKSQKPVRLNLDNEVELAEDCQGMGPGTSSTEREDDINTYHRPKAETTTKSTIDNHYIISRVVSNVVEEWQTCIELWEMQYTFIRQLQRDQEEIRRILDEAGERAKIEKELETVRADNKELRQFFGMVLWMDG